ncbi:MAG: hypothetical protein J6U41_02420 [Lachnospiraceae bacterium]|nr:hypothetical protein [Lachnospiraceae bacterium]MBO7095533.1 hypothetical protein [Lachnospiraceae bacterium]MBO7362230.1 hypothetical protein [Lachnospiraceae bacterium]MBO7531179.1 hypothetical protein [Lachnospiraceae bacterium]MBP5252797.1 hypothetical protein [Lachnospiraceae bacterium]
MAVNPIAMMQAAGRIRIFQEQHPKAIAFIQSISNGDLREGSVIELKVTTPEGKTSVSNIKLTKDDIETFNLFKNSQTGN